MTTTAVPAQTFTPTRRRFTVEEYCAMAEAGILAEEERVELLDGEIFVMPPIGAPHEDGTTRLSRDLILQLRRPRLGARADLSPPERLRVTRTGHRGRQVQRMTTTGTGPPPTDVLLVIEVSDSSSVFRPRRETHPLRRRRHPRGVDRQRTRPPGGSLPRPG